MNVNWRTSDPIMVKDPEYHILIKVRAFGQMGFRISNYSVFLRGIIGTMQQSEYVRFDKVQENFRGPTIERIKTVIGKIIIDEKISALEITTRLEEISEKTRSKVQETFEKYGLEIVHFFTKSINVPDEDLKRINDHLHKRAEFDIIGDARYALDRTFNVYETAAGNDSGVAGAFVAGGVGLGAGVALGSQMPQVMANTAPGGIICPECQTNNSTGGKFCLNCGNSLHKQTKPIACPHCSHELPEKSKFCNACGKSTEAPKCSKCETEVAHGSKFCNKCGTEVT